MHLSTQVVFVLHLLACWQLIPSAEGACVIQPDGVGHVDIPNTWTKIRFREFYLCEDLESVHIPISVETIRKEAFRGSGLRTINVGEGTKIIRYGAFMECYQLQTIVITDSVQLIDGSAFFSAGKDITGTVNLDLGNGVKTIDNKAFAHSKVGPTLTLPDSLESLDYFGQFLLCEDLESVHIPISVEIIGLQTFRGSGLRTINVGEGTKTIRHGAFMECYQLQTIVITDSVQLINGSAFYSAGKDITGAVNLDLGNGVKTIGKEAFAHSKVGPTLTLPDSLESIPGAMCNDCTSLEHLVVGTGLQIIGSKSFHGNGNLQTVTFQSSSNVKKIGGEAFKNCPKLHTIRFPQSINYIGKSAFEGSLALRTFSFPDKQIGFGQKAFFNAFCEVDKYAAGANVANDCTDCVPRWTPGIEPDLATTMSDHCPDYKSAGGVGGRPLYGEDAVYCSTRDETKYGNRLHQAMYHGMFGGSNADRDCGAWCVYDTFDADSKQFFRWDNKKECWKARKGKCVDANAQELAFAQLIYKSLCPW